MKISTIVCIVDLNVKINIPVFLDLFPSKDLDCIDNVLYNNFGNQVTIIFNLHKKINVKLFNNGKMQITGLTEKYKQEIDEIVNILYTNGKDIFGVHNKQCKKDTSTNLLVYNNSEIYGYKYEIDKYTLIGEIKKNNIYYINNMEIVPFDLSSGILTTKRHFDMKKPIFDTNGYKIGELEFMIKGGKVSKEKCIKDNHKIIQTEDCDMTGEFFVRRKIKNLTLKNKILKKFNDTTYLLFNKSKGKKEEIDMYSPNNKLTNKILDTYNLYAIISVQYNENYKKFLDFMNNKIDNFNLCIDYKLFSNLIFINNYSINIANINTDLTIEKRDNIDLFNLYMLLQEFEKYPFLYQKIITYEPSKYPALKISFPELNTSLRIFRTFKIKFSGNNLDNINIIKNNLIKFINEKYSNIVVSTKKVEIKETLSLSDLL